MIVRHPIGILHSLPINNISYDTMELSLFFFLCDNIESEETYLGSCQTLSMERFFEDS